MTVLTIFVFESIDAKAQAHRHFVLCKTPGAWHTFWSKTPGGGGMITSQCFTHIIDGRYKNFLLFQVREYCILYFIF